MRIPLKIVRLIPRRPFKYPRQLVGGGLIIAGIVGLVLTAISLRSDALSSGTPLNLIAGQDWSHMAGATPTADGIKITALGRAIVNQDGSDNQTNPPVNARGPQLNFNNALTISFKANQIPAQGNASFYLYSSVPIIYDEWRYQPPQLRIDLNQQKVTIYQWNGKSDKPASVKSWTIPVGSSAYTEITLGKKGGSVGVQVNGMLLGNLRTRKLFNSGHMWFGADNTLGSPDWTLKSLQAESTDGQLKIVPAANLSTTVKNDSLRNLSAAGTRKLPIGAAIANYALFSDPAYRQLAGSQINMLVPENELKAQFIHPQPGIYSFTEADNLVDFALANGMTVHGHNLVFSEANPRWMQAAPLTSRQQIMVDHINTIVSHYNSRINEWDVVDEPLNDNDDNHGNSSDLRQNIWLAAMGENYIDTAFRTAHQANPDAQLYLNEYGLEADGPRWNEFLSLVTRLQARNVPINGVGFQAHVYEPGDEVDSATLQKHMQILANMGLKSRISELDVYGDSAQHQSDQYVAALKACLASPNCTSFTMWGLSDKYGSTSDTHNYPLSYGNDLVWDEYMQPKPVYQNLQNTLKSF